MAVTDLTGTKWSFPLGYYSNIPQIYGTFLFESDLSIDTYKCYMGGGDYLTLTKTNYIAPMENGYVYSQSKGCLCKYTNYSSSFKRTPVKYLYVTFVSITVDQSLMISWLEANATQILPVSFKRYYKNTRFIGTGTYKFRPYTVIQPQLSTPVNVSADGTTVSWDEVENATSYEILADGMSIGTVEK